MGSEVLAFTLMISVEFTDMLAATISKAAMTNGMSSFVSVIYYNALATILLLPYIVLFRKKPVAPAPLTFSILWRFFLLALIGSTGQILYYTGVKYSSTTLASSLANLIPIITYFLAVALRMEKVDIRKSSSQAKIFGAIVAVIGAFIVTLYKGKEILTATRSPQQQSDWVFGGSLLLIVFFLSATWNVFQAATVKEYPDKMMIVFFFTLFVTIQSAIFSLVLERNHKAWRVNSRIEIISILCTAILGSMYRIYVHTWSLDKKGPIFVVMFRPLGVVIAIIMAVLFLGDVLHLGSVIGSVIIAAGFYSVMWGQIKEKKNLESSSSITNPLLQDDKADEQA